MAKSIARLTGTALRVGPSLNKRYYSRECIADMAAEVQKRIDSGGEPVSMMTHHAAEDCSTAIVGKVERVWTDADGNALFEGSLADTPEAHTILSLVDTEGDGPWLRGVSIRGYWEGDLRQIDIDGVPHDTGDVLRLDGLDFTKTPGSVGSGVASVTRTAGGKPRESDGRTPIYETAEAQVTSTVTETAPTGQPPEIAYADNGYRPDGQKRYPLGSRRHALEAWSALAEADVAREYTSKQLRRARGRTARALERHGFTVTSEGYVRAAGPVQEAWASTDGDSGYCIALHVGPLRVEVASYAVDPHDLDRISRAAASAAADALRAVMADPDAGSPVEGGKPAFLDDEDTAEEEAPPGKPCPPGDEDPDDEDERAVESAPTAATPAADDKEEPAVADTSTTETTPSIDPAAIAAIVEEKVTARLAAIEEQRATAEAVRLAEEKAAQEAAVAEQARIAEAVAAAVDAKLAELGVAVPAAEETEGQRIDRLAEEKARTLVQAGVERNGPPARTGFVPGATATESAQAGLAAAGLPDKPMHQYNQDDEAARRRAIGAEFLSSIPGMASLIG